MDELSALKTKAEQGDAEAQYALGKFYLDKYETSYTDEDEETAQRWFELAAEQGHREAQYCLAGLIRDDDGDPTAESAQWLQVAAEQGHAEACMSLCYDILESGDGNEREAIKWYRRARELGHPHDAEMLGYRDPYSELGLSYIVDVVIYWKRKYAEAGDTQAQHNLGEIYLTGRGYPLNFVHAYAWCAVAANHVPGATVEELHGPDSDWLERETPEGIIRLLEHIFDEDERGQAHRLALEYLEKFRQKQVWRLKALRFCAYWHEMWQERMWLLLLGPLLIVMLVWYLLIAVVASVFALQILEILGPSIALGTVVLIIGLALWMRHQSRREEREAFKRLRK